ncbi:MAG: DUF1573 domain-containing protein [Planctomycetota bacterium]
MLWCILALGAAAGPAAIARRPEVEASLAVELFGLEPTGLEFTQRVLDFGTVFAGETVVREFEFENASDGPVRILEADGTCGCLQARPSARWIEAGARGSVRAELLLDGRYGPQDLRIRVRTDESEQSGTLLTLRGRAKVVVRPRPARLILRELTPGSTLERRIQLQVLEPIDDPRIEGRGVDAALEHEGDQLFVRAGIRVAMAVGPKFCGILVKSRHRETGRDVETWIPVIWTVPSPLIVQPAEAVLVGGRAEITVRSRWPELARIGEVDAGSLPLKVTRTGEDPLRLTLVNMGKSWEIPIDAVIRLRVHPASLGPVEVPVRIRER